MRELNIIDALGLACLIIAGGCALAVLFGIFEAAGYNEESENFLGG